MARQKKIKLGDEVRCKYSGFTGVAVARTEFINGCIQFAVVPRVGPDNKLEDDMAFDESSLEIIEENDFDDDDDEEENGGPIRKAPKFKGY